MKVALEVVRIKNLKPDMFLMVPSHRDAPGIVLLAKVLKVEFVEDESLDNTVKVSFENYGLGKSFIYVNGSDSVLAVVG